MDEELEAFVNRTLVTEYKEETVNVVDGLFAIADALNNVAKQVKNLGNADAASPMGALENLACETKNASERIASALETVALSIQDSG